MKRARVSSVYEGRRRKRSREEEDSRSRWARMHARARRCRRKPNLDARSFVIVKKAIMKRSASVVTRSNAADNKNNKVCKDKGKGKEIEIAEPKTTDPDQSVSPTTDSDESVSDPSGQIDNMVTSHENTNPESVIDLENQTQSLFKCQTDDAELVGHPALMANWEGEPVWWEEWPLSWTYEEQWMWSQNPYWETMDHSSENDNDEPYWWDDIWNFRSSHQTSLKGDMKVKNFHV